MIATLSYLSGAQRGATRRLGDDSLQIGPGVILEKIPEGYVARVGSDGRLWVNGEPVKRRVLESGDVLESGEGVVVRFRLYPPGSRPLKSMREAFADCLDCAARSGRSAIGRVAEFLISIPREILTQTSWWVRGGLLATIVGLMAISLWLYARNADLSTRLATVESTRAIGLEELLTESEHRFLTPEDLAAVRAEIEARLRATDVVLETTQRRLEGLEVRSEALRNAIAGASRSIVFLQGSYTFVEETTGRPLRYATDSRGAPLRTRDGSLGVSVEGDGPIAEALFTGSAFVASEDGLLVTNRHVVMPWEANPARLSLMQSGFRPVLHRFVGYLPGHPDPFDVEFVTASDEADLAVLRCSLPPASVRPLALSSARPVSGDEVVVLGYPTGIRALMARADPKFLAAIDDDSRDFWKIVESLARFGLVTPLATRGIIGQITDAAIVYDAETTHGGSGGPVLGIDGRVVAINTAVLADFGGSNLGVPADHARALLDAIGP